MFSKSDILDDATVEEILKMVGESCENADHRKKSKEPKHAAMKKEKKKTKKQKKAEKKKATGPKVLSDPESSEPVSKVELEEKSVYSGPGKSSLSALVSVSICYRVGFVILCWRHLFFSLIFSVNRQFA